MLRKLKTSLIFISLIVVSCSLIDPTRCDNGCGNRKDGYYLMKSYPGGGANHKSAQSGWSKSQHAYRGKEFCSRSCGNSWYKKQ